MKLSQYLNEKQNIGIVTQVQQLPVMQRQIFGKNQKLVISELPIFDYRFSIKE